MSEKRFTLKNWNDYAEGDCIYYDDGEEMGSLDVLDTLNELNDENIELHIQNDFLKDENQHMRTVLNENKQLKEEKRLLARFIRRNHDVTMINRILNK